MQMSGMQLVYENRPYMHIDLDSTIVRRVRTSFPDTTIGPNTEPQGDPSPPPVCLDPPSFHKAPIDNATVDHSSLLAEEGSSSSSSLSPVHIDETTHAVLSAPLSSDQDGEGFVEVVENRADFSWTTMTAVVLFAAVTVGLLLRLRRN
jgi:hypothetical protein